MFDVLLSQSAARHDLNFQDANGLLFRSVNFVFGRRCLALGDPKYDSDVQDSANQHEA